MSNKIWVPLLSLELAAIGNKEYFRTNWLFPNDRQVCYEAESFRKAIENFNASEKVEKIIKEEVSQEPLFTFSEKLFLGHFEHTANYQLSSHAFPIGKYSELLYKEFDCHISKFVMRGKFADVSLSNGEVAQVVEEILGFDLIVNPLPTDIELVPSALERNKRYNGLIEKIQGK